MYKHKLDVCRSADEFFCTNFTVVHFYCERETLPFCSLLTMESLQKWSKRQKALITMVKSDLRFRVRIYSDQNVNNQFLKFQ